jgi:hypothetical protein
MEEGLLLAKGLASMPMRQPGAGFQGRDPSPARTGAASATCIHAGAPAADCTSARPPV